MLRCALDRVEGKRGASLPKSVSSQLPPNRTGRLALHPAFQHGEHFKQGASLVRQGITKSQHQVIWWLILTHKNCSAPGLKCSPIMNFRGRRNRNEPGADANSEDGTGRSILRKYSENEDLKRVPFGYGAKESEQSFATKRHRSLDFDTPSATQSAFAQSIIPWTIKKPGG